MRIGTKVIAVALVTASIFAGTTVFGLSRLQELAHQQRQVYRSNVSALVLMNTIRQCIGLQTVAVYIKELDLQGIPTDLQRPTATADAQLDDSIAGLEALKLSNHEQVLAFASLADQWQDVYHAAMQEGVSASLMGRANQLGRTLQSRADALNQELVAAVARGTAQSLAYARRTVQVTALLGAIGAVFVVALSVLAARTISRPLRAAVRVVTRVGQGDFSQRLESNSTDEVGQLGSALNVALQELDDAFAQIRHRADHDHLTGLANRALLRESISEAIAVPSDDRFRAVLLIDLDGFKQVNDQHGHATGDALLVAVAERLRSGMRAPGDVAARLGGDEFAVLLVDLESPHAAYLAACRLLTEVQQPIELPIGRICPRASIGVAVHRAGLTPEHLLRDADVAMYAAKEAGKGTVIAFPPDAARAAIMAKIP